MLHQVLTSGLSSSPIVVTIKRWGLFVVPANYCLDFKSQHKTCLSSVMVIYLLILLIWTSHYIGEKYFFLKYVICKVHLVYRLLKKLLKHYESLIINCNKNATFHACAKNRSFGFSTITPTFYKITVK